MADPAVSVVIPAHNAAKTIAQTLQGLTDQDCGWSYEIIVVDDGSTDNTAELVKAFAHVTYIYQHNAGPAHARNRGAKAAGGEIILFTDADCIPHKNWLQTMLARFHDGNVGVVAGSYGIANPESLLAKCVHNEILYRHRYLMPVNPKVFGSFNFGIKRSVFDEVGGFDAGYRQASGEDNDLGYRLLKKGYQIYFDKNALVDHHHPESLWKYLKEQFRHGFWRARIYAHHPDMLVGDDYTFWKDALEIPLSLLFLLTFVLGILSIWPPAAAILIGSFLLSLELIFAVLMCGSLGPAIYWACVMCLRAFARTIGLGVGFVCLPWSRPGLTGQSS